MTAAAERGALPRSPHGARQGLSRVQVEARYSAQQGLCTLCGDPLQKYFADHDHALAPSHGHLADRGCPKCFRSLLCPRCNTLVGMAGDSVDLLERAIAYLRAWQAQLGREARRG